MRTVTIGPKPELHEGCHYSLIDEPPSGYSYRPRCSRHFFLFRRKTGSPFRDSHFGELVDFGPGRGLVHASRWPVLNRQSWVVDMDDFGYPVLCGRHAISPVYRRNFRKVWTQTFEDDIKTRVVNMLTAYAHPSCKAILFQTQRALQSCADWGARLGLQQLTDQLYEKSTVLYPVQRPCPKATFQEKWNRRFPMAVIFCGRDFQAKNGMLALRIFARLAKENPTVTFVYIGRIPKTDFEKHKYLFERVHFRASLPKNELLRLFESSHVIFHPSISESVGSVLLEAAAYGLAVVSAKGKEMAHLTEFFGHGGALLLDRESVPESEEEFLFETYLRRLLENPKEARNLGAFNYESATVGILSLARRDQILQARYDAALRNPSEETLSVDLFQKKGFIAKDLSSKELDECDLSFRSEIDHRGLSILI